jgi:hypothetical protein
MARSTIAVVVVFVFMAGGAWALNATSPPPAPSDATVYVLDVKDTDVQGLNVRTNGGTVAFERADPFGWTFAESGSQADLSRVGSVVNRLAKLRSSARVTDNATDLAPYGLAPPAITADLRMKDGTVQRIIVGGKTVNDAAYYAMVEGRPQLHTINTLIVGDIEKLITDPPVPTPTPDPNVTATPTPAATVTPAPGPTRTPAPDATAPPTIGLPRPAVGE